MPDFQRNKYVARYQGTIEQSSFVADDIRKEQKFNQRLEKESKNKLTIYEKDNKDEVLNKGIEFAYQDVNLEGIENAPEELKNLKIFVRGYEVGIRRIKAAGNKHYMLGKTLDEAEPILKNHIAFVEGYNKAYEQANGKGHKSR